MGTQVRAVTFDADGTLWDFEAAMRSGLAVVLAEIRRLAPGRADGLTVEHMVSARDEAAAELKRRGASLMDMRREGFRRVMESAGLRDGELKRRLVDAYVASRIAATKPYPDVVPALELISERWPIGVITNGNSDPEQCGLPGRFSFVITAEECGFEKPDPRVFHVAAEKAGCLPHEVVHVGDKVATDVDGALAAGATAVWLNRDRSTANAGQAHEIRSLTELPGLLDRLSKLQDVGLGHAGEGSREQ